MPFGGCVLMTQSKHLPKWQLHKSPMPFGGCVLMTSQFLHAYGVTAESPMPFGGCVLMTRPGTPQRHCQAAVSNAFRRVCADDN